MIRVDCHVHTSERSGCSNSTAEEMIAEAASIGLDVIFITDHERLVPADELKRLQSVSDSVSVFGGIEISVGNEEHIVVLGLQNTELETNSWTYRDLHAFVKEHEGLMILAHPFRYSLETQLPLGELPPDACEIHSTNTGRCDADAIRGLVKEMPVQLTHNSDSHHIRDLGVYHIETDCPADEQSILDAIRSGQFIRACIQSKVEAYNAVIEPAEIEIRQMIADGHDVEYYMQKTGMWRGRFDRVAMGKSYLI